MRGKDGGERVDSDFRSLVVVVVTEDNELR